MLLKSDITRGEARSAWANFVTCESAETRYASIFLNGVTQTQYDNGEYGQWDIYQAALRTYPTNIYLIPGTANISATQFGFCPNITLWSQIDSGAIQNLEWKDTSGTKT